MSSAIQLPSIAMEDPLADTMDVASPYGGHGDDFEIDIDVMEDDTANIDGDYDLRDASPEPAHQDQGADADMMDDVGESSEPYSAAPHETTTRQERGSFVSENTTYESEMLDDDYEEDADAPIVDSEVAYEEQPPVEAAKTTTTPAEHSEQITEQREHPEAVNGDQSYVADAAAQDDKKQPDDVSEVAQVTEGAAATATSEDQAEGHDNNVEKVENKDEQPAAVADDGHEASGDLGDARPQEEASKVAEEQSDGPHAVSEEEAVAEAQEEREEEEQEPEGDFQDSDHHDEYFHPVKVLYQGNEISMFPPREGDASETFFVEDESLVYEDLATLMASCRHVLGDHVSAEDALVFDIDSLGIQIAEDNMYASKVTLSQIVDVYLFLCQNDGIEEPEPLYLTLTTKPTLLAVLSNLEQIANEGKGISDAQTWETYEEEDVDEAEHDLPVETDDRGADVSEGQPPEEDADRPVIAEKTAESEHEEAAVVERHEAKHIEQADENADRAPEAVSESSADDADLKHTKGADRDPETTEDQEPDIEDPGDNAEEPAHVLEGDDVDHGTKAHSFPEKASSIGSEAREKTSYQAEERAGIGETLMQPSADGAEDHQDKEGAEAPAEDGGSLVALPGDEPGEGQPEEAQDVVEDNDHEDDEQDESQTADADETYYEEPGDFDGDEWHVEDKTAIEFVDAPGESQDDSTTLSHEENSPRDDDNNDLQLAPEADDALQEALDGAKPTKTSSRTDEGRQISEAPEDLLGLDDEIFTHPEKENIDENEASPVESAEDAGQEDGQGVDELGFGDDYVHVDEPRTGAEAARRNSSHGDVSPSRERGSAKRTRDPEDDLDHLSSPTPNTKRSRSS